MLLQRIPVTRRLAVGDTAGWQPALLRQVRTFHGDVATPLDRGYHGLVLQALTQSLFRLTPWLLAVGVLGTVASAGKLLVEHYHRASLVRSVYEPAPPGMVFVPAGYFLMGSDDLEAEPDEQPLRWEFVPAFYIDRFEVTNRRYREVNEDHLYPEGADELPVSFVLKKEAQAYAKAVGKRLPSGAEWEKAARGADGRTYPWGSTFEPTFANVRAVGTNEWGMTCLVNPNLAPGEVDGKRSVGSFPQGASPYGCEDMAGNVWEWVGDDWWDRDAWGRKEPGRRGVIRGGAYAYSHKQARTSYQGFEGIGATCNDVGFRCAMDAKLSPH